MRRFVIGDIHGAYKALLQCTEKANFDKDKDLLICLGDVADSWPEVPECFNYLLEIKNLVYIMGNHDFWMLNHITAPRPPEVWTRQGGQATIEAYVDRKTELALHLAFLRDLAVYCHVTDDNKLFVHGGYDITLDNPLASHEHDFMWDRELFYSAIDGAKKENIGLDKFDEVFIGHTQTECVKHFGYGISNDAIVHLGNLWNIDTGAGWSGMLTMLDIDTKQVYQSDKITNLYPNYQGR